MRFLCLYRSSAPENAPPTEPEIAAMGKFIEAAFKAGVLITTEGCQPSSKGARVRLADGRFAVTVGPFTETKELVGGFALLNVNSTEEALQWVKRFMNVAGDGETEIRLLHDAPAHA